MRSGILFIFVLWLVFSCQEIKNCELESSTDYLITNFYRSDTSVQTSKTVAFTSIKSLESPYYLTSVLDTVDDDTLSAMVLFLNSEVKKTTYIFETESLDYELTIEYTPHLRIYYEECDPVFSYKIDTAYSDQFDSVVVVNPTLDWEVTKNLELYL